MEQNPDSDLLLLSQIDTAGWFILYHLTLLDMNQALAKLNTIATNIQSLITLDDNDLTLWKSSSNKVLCNLYNLNKLSLSADKRRTQQQPAPNF